MTSFSFQSSSFSLNRGVYPMYMYFNNSCSWFCSFYLTLCLQIIFFLFFCFFFEFYFIYILYNRFLLVINFIHISVYMSIPISQFITPPAPSPCRFPPLVSIRLFSTSVSQFLPQGVPLNMI